MNRIETCYGVHVIYDYHEVIVFDQYRDMDDAIEDATNKMIEVAEENYELDYELAKECSVDFEDLADFVRKEIEIDGRIEVYDNDLANEIDRLISKKRGSAWDDIIEAINNARPGVIL